jgi:2-polyprenyl-3-methyl-5-hydroxy-6-metoxy-1,4-benzoquinol methylase
MDLRAKLPIFAKKWIWNFKYGVKKYSSGGAPADVVAYLRRLPPQASLLELGCGHGFILKELRSSGWAGKYLGLDISAAAVKVASSQDQSGRSEWVVSDIESFRTDKVWDVILMIESVYYLKLPRVPEVLGMLHRRLTPEGFLLLRIHDDKKHRHYIDALQMAFPRIQRSGFLYVIPSHVSTVRAAGSVPEEPSPQLVHVHNSPAED